MKQDISKKLPLLAGSDRPFWPASDVCPVCRCRMREGVAYISGGADLRDARNRNSVRTPRLKAFLAIGFHGKEVDVSDSFNAAIVSELAGGQFDLQFCSLDCLLTAIAQIVEEGKQALAMAREAR